MKVTEYAAGLPVIPRDCDPAIAKNERVGITEGEPFKKSHQFYCIVVFKRRTVKGFAEIRREVLIGRLIVQKEVYVS